MTQNIPIDNSWKIWMVLKRISLSKKNEYPKVIDLYNEINKDNIISYPYFLKALKFFEDKTVIDYLENEDVKPFKPFTIDKIKAVQLTFEFIFVDEVEDFLKKGKKVLRWVIE